MTPALGRSPDSVTAERPSFDLAKRLTGVGLKTLPGDKYLIVTGDDFGISHDVNLAILRAHREGIMTSASLMVNESGFEEAVQIARSAPTLAVGLHLALSSAHSTLPPEEISSLTDGNRSFQSSPTRSGLRYFFSQKAKLQLEREIRAQLEKLLSAGLALDHVNGHQHLHMHPVVFSILLGVREEYRIPAFRIVRDSLRLNLRLDRAQMLKKGSYSFIFGALSHRCLRQIQGLPITHADRVWGLLQDGNLHRDHLDGLIRQMPAGITEIYCHPSVGSGAESGRCPDREFEGLIDPGVAKLVEERGIRLTTYGRLGAGPSLPKRSEGDRVSCRN